MSMPLLWGVISTNKSISKAGCRAKAVYRLSYVNLLGIISFLRRLFYKYVFQAHKQAGFGQRENGQRRPDKPEGRQVHLGKGFVV